MAEILIINGLSNEHVGKYCEEAETRILSHHFNQHLQVAFLPYHSEISGTSAAH